ncbi:hypothetical protein ACVRW4_08375 [Streptococcus phocae subsp. phocae]
MEVMLVKEVIITPLLLDDKTAAKTFSISEGEAATARREMKDIPRFTVQLSNFGRLVDAKVFKEYLDYRGSNDWKKELERCRNKKRTQL